MVAVPMLLAAVLGGIYLAFDPPSADLAAQTFRADFFDAHGFAVWSNSWYAGFHLPGYSLLYPPLGAWLGVRLVGVLSAVAAAGLFGALARDRFGERAKVGVLWFAVGITTNLLTGRITFGLGVAVGLGALLALQRSRPRLAAALAVLTSFASPVAGLFCALAGAAVAISRRPSLAGPRAWVGGAAVAAGALGGIAALVLAFPVEGIEPFAVSAFVNVPLFAVVALVLIPGDERTLRWGVGLYAVLGILVFAFDNAAGGNVTRLGALFAGPVMALALWGRRPLALAILALPLLWWQWAASVRDLNDAVGDPAVEASFYEPLLEELETQTVGAPSRVEVPPTRNRWEAKYVGESYPLARGWLRQAESDDSSLFKFDRLTPAAYLAWLRERAVGYVAVPQGVDRDYLADDEVALIDGGLPYLRLVWENDDWRLYEVRGEAAFVTTPGGSGDPVADARLASLGPTSFELTADAPGDYQVRLHYTRYWKVSSGDACLLRDGDWTTVRARAAGVIRVDASFGLDALFGARDSC